jgi:hypothetical protein
MGTYIKNYFLIQLSDFDVTYEICIYAVLYPNLSLRSNRLHNPIRFLNGYKPYHIHKMYNIIST